MKSTGIVLARRTIPNAARVMRLAMIVVVQALSAARAMAQTRDQVALMSCQNAATNDVRGQRPEADSVRFSPNPVVTEQSKQQASVQGAGRYFDRIRRQWRPFIYQCAYRPGSAKTRVTVHIDSISGTN